MSLVILLGMAVAITLLGLTVLAFVYVNREQSHKQEMERLRREHLNELERREFEKFD